MAEAASVYAEETTQQTTTNTTYTTVKSITLSANTKYLILVSAFINGSDAAAVSSNVIINIASTDQSGSEVNIEPTSSSSGNYRCYSYMDVYTTGGSTETLNFQIKSSSGDTARADSIVINAIDLSDLTEGSDYKFGEDDDLASPVTNGTTWADRASATFTNGTSGDDWLVLGYVQWDVNDVGIRYEGRINQDSGTETLPAFSVEGENTAEIRNALMSRVYTLNDTSSHTFKIQVQDSATGSNDHRLSRVFCLRLNAFETHTSSWDATAFGNGGSTDWAEMGALNPTPATAGNWIVGGTVAMDVRGAGKKAAIRVQESGTTLLTGLDSDWHMSGNDNNDDDPCFFFTRENFTASAKDIDYDGKFDSAFDQPSIKYRSFWAFSLELSAASPTTLTKTTSLDAKILKNDLTKTTSIDAKVQKQDIGVTASFDAKVVKQLTKIVSVDAKVQKQDIAVTASFDAKVKKQGIDATASFDAKVVKQLTKVVSVDAKVQKQNIAVTASFDAKVQKELTKIVSVDAKVQKQDIAATTSFDALIISGFSVSTSLDAKVQKPDITITASFDATVVSAGAITRTKTVGLDAEVALPIGYIEGGFVRKAVSTISGLFHLVNEDVVILADGNVVSNKTVSSTGTLTLDRKASRVHVGKGFTADIETLDIEAPEGTIQNLKTSVRYATIRMEKTRGIQTGPNEQWLRDMKFRENEAYDEPTRLFTGDKTQTMDPTWKTNGRILIRQAYPLPMKILAVIPKVDIGGASAR